MYVFNVPRGGISRTTSPFVRVHVGASCLGTWISICRSVRTQLLIGSGWGRPGRVGPGSLLLGALVGFPALFILPTEGSKRSLKTGKEVLSMTLGKKKILDTVPLVGLSCSALGCPPENRSRDFGLPS